MIFKFVVLLILSTSPAWAQVALRDEPLRISVLETEQLSPQLIISGRRIGNSCIPSILCTLFDPLPQAEAIDEAVTLRDCSCFVDDSAQPTDDVGGIAPLVRTCECYRTQNNVAQSSVAQILQRAADERENGTVLQNMLNRGVEGYGQIFDMMRLGGQTQALYASLGSSDPSVSNLMNRFSQAPATTEAEADAQVRISERIRAQRGLVSVGDSASSGPAPLGRQELAEVENERGHNFQSSIMAGLTMGNGLGAITPSTTLAGTLVSGANLLTAGAANSVANNRSNIITPPRVNLMSPQSYEDTVIKEDPQRTPENCVSMKQFRQFMQAPEEGDSIYAEIDRLRSNPPTTEDQWTDFSESWNLKSMVSQLEFLNDKSTLSQPENDEKSLIEAKLRFISFNPVIGNVLGKMSGAADRGNPNLRNAKAKVLQYLSTAFSPTNCGKNTRSSCVAADSLRRQSLELQLLSDPDVQNFSRQGGDEQYNDLKRLTEENPLAYLVDFPSLDGLTDKLRNERFRRNPVDVGEACADVEYINDPRVRTELNQSRGAYATASYLRQIANSASLDKEKNDDFKNFTEKMCRMKRCEKEKECLVSEMVSFQQFYASSSHARKCDRVAEADVESCWQHNMTEYLERYKASGNVANEIFTNKRYSDSEDVMFEQFNRRAPPSHSTATTRSNIALNASVDLSRAENLSAAGRATPGEMVDGQIVVRGRRNSVSAFDRARLSRAANTGARRVVDATSSTSRDPQSVTRGGPASTAIVDVPSRDLLPSTRADQALPGNAAANTAILPSSTFVSTSAVRAQLSQQMDQNRSIASSARDEAEVLASAVVSSSDPAEIARLRAEISRLELEAQLADRNVQDLARRIEVAQRDIEDRNRVERDERNDRAGNDDPARGALRPGLQQPAYVAPQLPQISANGGSQTFGNGEAGTVALPPVNIRSSNGRATAVNFNFKYGTDVRSIGKSSSGAGGIIVAGESSAFLASDQLGAAANSAASIDLGAVGEEVSQLLIARDPATLERYRSQIMEQTGNVVRIRYTDGEQVAREILIVKGADGQLLVPAVRDLASARVRARLADIRTILSTE